MRVLIAGGGTAGHVFPALALAGRLVEAHGAEVRFAGTPTGQEAKLVAEAGYPFVAVDAQPLRRELSLRAVGAPLATLRSVSKCRPLVESADVVIGMGGYVSVPVAVAAARAGRPLVLHEQNAVPGLANRLLARPADVVALAFAEAARILPHRTRTVVTGNPVRDAITNVRDARDLLAKEAIEALDLESGRTTVVVFGGSQGALHINRAMVGALELLEDRDDLQVLLLTGAAHLDPIARKLPRASALHVRSLAFLDRMELAYSIADLVVSRAGATTCAEVTVCGLPSILIPYPYATGRHQEANARALQRAGAAVVMMDDVVSAASLAARIRELTGDRARLRAMGERAEAWAKPDAAARLAEVVVEVAR